MWELNSKPKNILIMAKKVTKKTWGRVFPKTSISVKPTELDKQRITAKFAGVVQSLNERSAKEENAENDEKEYNYPILVFSKWYANFFYISVKYRCPSPHAIAPYFESGLARLQMTGTETCTLSYMRHTDKWHPLYENITLEHAIKAVEENPYFFVF